MSDRVSLPQRVLEGIEAVRESGLTNMFDRNAVAYLAEQMGYADAASWLRASRDEYARGILHGFEVEPEIPEPPAMGTKQNGPR